MEKKLKVYCIGDTDCYVAYDLEEAIKGYCEHIGESNPVYIEEIREDIEEVNLNDNKIWVDFDAESLIKYINQNTRKFEIKYDFINRCSDCLLLLTYQEALDYEDDPKPRFFCSSEW